MYALCVDSKDTKNAKGVKNNVVARTITFDDYTKCLRDRDDATADLYMFQIASCIYSIRNENCSKSIQRQAIYHVRFDRDATVGTLADTLIIFCVLRTSYFTHILYFVFFYFAFHVFYSLHFMYFTFYIYFAVLHLALYIFYVLHIFYIVHFAFYVYLQILCIL